MSEHTPGPWTVHAGPSIEALPLGPHGPIVGVAYTQDGDPLEQAANARLIAAAPDLLRELIRLANRCQGRMTDPRYPNWHDGCCTDARALIERLQGTEGREP